MKKDLFILKNGGIPNILISNFVVNNVKFHGSFTFSDHILTVYKLKQWWNNKVIGLRVAL